MWAERRMLNVKLMVHIVTTELLSVKRNVNEDWTPIQQV